MPLWKRNARHVRASIPVSDAVGAAFALAAAVIVSGENGEPETLRNVCRPVEPDASDCNRPDRFPTVRPR